MFDTPASATLSVLGIVLLAAGIALFSAMEKRHTPGDLSPWVQMSGAFIAEAGAGLMIAGSIAMGSTLAIFIGVPFWLACVVFSVHATHRSQKALRRREVAQA